MLAVLLAMMATDAANAGREAMRRGDLPSAILAFRKGLQQDASNRILKDDLNAARKNVSYPDDAMAPLTEERWLQQFSEKQFYILLLLLVAANCLLVYKALTRRPRWARIGVIAVSVLTIFVASTLARELTNRTAESLREIAVVSKPAILRKGNGESFTQVFSSPLPAGAELQILHRRGGWVQVMLPRGAIGWLPAAAVLQ